MGKLHLIAQLIRYNLKIIFANKFIYFLLAAVGFFLMIAIISLFDPDAYPTEEGAYYLMILPGLLLIFYPSAFGIQNDVENRTIELFFGIPNYRYKVWLVRLGIIYGVVYLILLLIGLLSSLIFVPVPVFEMSFHLMFPIFFFGALGFMFSTLIRSGNGTAAVMVVIGLIIWITSGIFEGSKWMVFLNPYDIPRDLNPGLWADTIFYNRLYLLIGIVLAVLAGLFRLQKRERFI